MEKLQKVILFSEELLLDESLDLLVELHESAIGEVDREQSESLWPGYLHIHHFID